MTLRFIPISIKLMKKKHLCTWIEIAIALEVLLSIIKDKALKNKDAFTISLDWDQKMFEEPEACQGMFWGAVRGKEGERGGGGGGDRGRGERGGWVGGRGEEEVVEKIVEEELKEEMEEEERWSSGAGG